jgi:hypothetical protein
MQLHPKDAQMVSFAVIFIIILAIPVAITLLMPARWFGAYVALAVAAAVYIVTHWPEPDFSSPLGGLDEWILGVLGALVSVALVIRACVIIAKNRASARRHSVAWSIALAGLFVMLMWAPDTSWPQSAIVLAEVAGAIVVLRASLIGLQRAGSTGQETAH